MKEVIALIDAIAKSYETLSGKLKEATDYVVDSSVEIATRSLRSISNASDLSTTTFSRLAKPLGFASYENMRENSRYSISNQLTVFSNKAKRIREESADINAPSFLNRQSLACEQNITSQAMSIDQNMLQRAVNRLPSADKVLGFASLASSFITEYFIYLSKWFIDHCYIVGNSGNLFTTALAHVSKKSTIIIADSHTCPAYHYADVGFIVPCDSPQFFSSYAGTVVLIKSIIGMLVSKIGATAEDRISEVEKQNKQLRIFC